ncbi:MAG: hypothetical protein ABIL06_16035 [Pseudomonadota bacterium]
MEETWEALAKLRVPQKYHLDISNIQHHRKVVIPAIKRNQSG